jgi:hypothetical protein
VLSFLASFEQSFLQLLNPQRALGESFAYTRKLFNLLIEQVRALGESFAYTRKLFILLIEQ